MTNPTTPEDKIDAILDAHLNELKAGHGGKLKVALLALLNEARIEEHELVLQRYVKIASEPELVPIPTLIITDRLNELRAATPKEEQ